jgi:hypothetical protein
MDANIEFLIRKKMTNAICLAGGNLSIIRKLSKNKYVSKKELNRLLDMQEAYLERIEGAKDQLLTLL